MVTWTVPSGCCVTDRPRKLKLFSFLLSSGISKVFRILFMAVS